MLKPYNVDAYALERVIYEAQAMTPDQAGRFMRRLAGPLAEGQLAGQYALLAIGTCAGEARGYLPEARPTPEAAAEIEAEAARRTGIVSRAARGG